MCREHALVRGSSKVPSRWCSRNTKKPHAQSVYLFEMDCTVRNRGCTSCAVGQIVKTRSQGFSENCQKCKKKPSAQHLAVTM
ncbi:hypothetical protein Y032_0159g3304 [Ancylostoma ceylanicum]|uniref:Uncharacterized protein n=1 Tax=Ancylostoma ceylanicum TaxID=53326 RepID=A0A016SXP8_9BILA|nr:hypothetical protein Y032_0159g3304 [Ancylostoma ceylanicum]